MTFTNVKLAGLVLLLLTTCVSADPLHHLQILAHAACKPEDAPTRSTSLAAACAAAAAVAEPASSDTTKAWRGGQSGAQGNDDTTAQAQPSTASPRVGGGPALRSFQPPMLPQHVKSRLQVPTDASVSGAARALRELHSMAEAIMEVPRVRARRNPSNQSSCSTTLKYLVEHCQISKCKWSGPVTADAAALLTCTLDSAATLAQDPPHCSAFNDCLFNAKVVLPGGRGENTGTPLTPLSALQGADAVGAVLSMLKLASLEVRGPWTPSLLAEIVRQPLPGLRKFTARGGLTDLPTAVLRFLPGVQTLDLSFNYFTALPANAFSNNTQLSYLTLRDNSIASLPKVLPEETFAGIPDLKYLYLSKNSLASVPESLFSKLPNLLSLSIAGNKLSVLPENLLEQQTQLETIFLDNNGLTHLDDRLLAKTAQLQSLLVGHNRLEIVHGDLFKHLNTSIRVLDFGVNQIRKFPHEYLEHLQQLTYIGLNDNPLSVFALKTAPGVQDIGIDLAGTDLIELILDGTVVAFLNVSYTPKLVQLTISTGTVRTLDISHSSLPRSQVDCNIVGKEKLLVRSMIDASWDGSQVIRKCLGGVDRTLLDVSGLRGLKSVGQIRGAVRRLFALDSDQVTGSNYFLEEATQLHYPVRVAPLLLAADSVLDCDMRVTGATLYNLTNDQFIPYRKISAMYFHCGCIVGYDERSGVCYNLQPWSAKPGHVAIIVIASILVGMGLFLGVERFRRHVRAMHADLTLHQHLLADAEFEVLELKAAWQLDASDITLVNRIDVASPGAYGAVWHGDWDGVPVAVKVLRAGLLELDAATADEFAKEAEFMMHTRHANVVRFFGAGRMADGEPFLVLELVARGSLRQLLDAQDGTPFESGLSCSIAGDVARGMAYIHSLGHMHRDLKSGNVLVTEGWRAKVADFGSIRGLLLRGRRPVTDTATATPFSISDTASLLQTQGVGTPLYMALEVLQEANYGPPADVWSFGIIVWELVEARVPDLLEQEGENTRGPGSERKLQLLLEAGKRLRHDSIVPSWAENMSQRCTETDPMMRPSFAELEAALSGSTGLKGTTA